MLNDETLRDGLQSPSVRTPTIERADRDSAPHGRARHRHRRHRPAGRRAESRQGRRAARARDRRGASHDPSQLRRAHRSSPTSGRSPKSVSGPAWRSSAARSSGRAPIRQYAEGWTLDYLQKCTEDALTFAVREGLPVMYVTEDTTRADPESLRLLFSTAIRAGASRLCIADTVGHATPNGARALVTYVKALLHELRRRPRRHRLARPPRSRIRRRVEPGGARSRRDAAARRRPRHRRALRQHADRSAARQSRDDGLHRSRSDGAAGVLPGRGARLRRADRRTIIRSSAPTRSERRPACTRRRS